MARIIAGATTAKKYTAPSASGPGASRRASVTLPTAKTSPCTASAIARMRSARAAVLRALSWPSSDFPRRQPFDRLVLGAEEQPHVSAAVQGDGLDELMIAAQGSAQHRERHARGDMTREFEQLELRPRGPLASDIDKGAPEPGLL